MADRQTYTFDEIYALFTQVDCPVTDISCLDVMDGEASTPFGAFSPFTCDVTTHITGKQLRTKAPEGNIPHKSALQTNFEPFNPNPNKNDTSSQQIPQIHDFRPAADVPVDFTPVIHEESEEISFDSVLHTETPNTQQINENLPQFAPAPLPPSAFPAQFDTPDFDENPDFSQNFPLVQGSPAAQVTQSMQSSSSSQVATGAKLNENQSFENPKQPNPVASWGKRPERRAVPLDFDNVDFVGELDWTKAKTKRQKSVQQNKVPHKAKKMKPIDLPIEGEAVPGWAPPKKVISPELNFETIMQAEKSAPSAPVEILGAPSTSDDNEDIDRNDRPDRYKSDRYDRSDRNDRDRNDREWRGKKGKGKHEPRFKAPDVSMIMIPPSGGAMNVNVNPNSFPTPSTIQVSQINLANPAMPVNPISPSNPGMTTVITASPIRNQNLHSSGRKQNYVYAPNKPQVPDPFMVQTSNHERGPPPGFVPMNIVIRPQ